MDNSRGRVKRHCSAFQYADKTISFNYWSRAQNGKNPDTIVFLGTGQSGRIAQWAAQMAPLGVIVVEGAPHWHADPSAEDLYDFMYAYTLAAFRAALNEFLISSVHLVAQSQAAPGVVRLGNNFPHQVNNIVLLAPLGFAATIFGNTPEARARTLMRRAGRTFFQLSQSPFYDPRNFYIGFMILRAIILESERGASKRKYGTGLSYDMREDCRMFVERQAKRGKIVILLLGDKDRIFMPQEIRPLVEAANIKGLKIHVLPGISHLSLAVRGGKKVLKAAVDLLRTGTTKGFAD